MSLTLLLPSLSLAIRESGASTPDSEKSLDGSPGLRILQKIASSLSQNGYRIFHLKGGSAFIATLRCSKGDLRVGIIISAAARKGGVLHCELDLWRIHSIFDGQAARRRRIQRDIDHLREVYGAIDRQVRTLFEIDAIRWARGARTYQSSEVTAGLSLQLLPTSAGVRDRFQSAPAPNDEHPST